MKDFVKCNILNTELLSTTVEDAVVVLREGISAKELERQYICNASVSDVMDARDDIEYLDALNGAYFVMPNSSQLVVEMHTQGYPMAKRIVVFDFMKRTFEMSNQIGIKHFFVCNNKETADCIELSLKESYPDINIAGAVSFDEDDIVSKINDSEADIVWLGIGGKEEAVWLKNNSMKINAISVGVGYGINSFVKGKVWNDTRRFRPDYVFMNLHYLALTGKKFLWTTLSWLPALMVIMTIFILSAQTGEVSKTTSGKIAEQVTYSSFWGYDLRGLALTSQQMDDLNSFIRFLAHIGEYALLSLTIGFAVTVNGFRKKLRFIYMCMLGFVVALADEFMQIFIEDRYGDFYDLSCDFLGILVMAFIVFVIGRKVKPKLEVPAGNGRRRRKFLNINIDDISFDDAVDKVIYMAKHEKHRYVVTPNVDHVMKNEKDMLFRKIYERADLIVTDGTPLMWIADSLGCPIKEKIPGSDMLPKICEKAAKENVNVFLFGAAEGVAAEAARRLQEKYPGLIISGTYSPPMGFDKNREEMDKAVKIINDANVDILVVGLGCPKQEKFIYNNMDKVNFAVALPFGASIDFEAGNVTRAPRWIRSIGMEWFYRFLQEPGRLFKRYFIDDLKIFWIAWKYRNEIIRIRTVENENSN